VPRRPRTDAAGAVHHVIARGNAGCRIVWDDTDRASLVSRLARVAEAFEWRVHAYCLMDTDVHVVVETPRPNLGVGMQRLVGGHAFWFNRRRGRSGHLFAGPYYAADVARDAHIVEAGIYVVLNPVRAGVVAHAGDWPWSSYRAVVGASPTPSWLSTEFLPSSLAPDPARARAIYEEMVEEGLLRPRAGSG
jgi:REP element-mobilizing transposase RayT